MKVVQAAIDWVRANKFDRDRPDSLNIRDSTLKKIAKRRDVSVDSLRRTLRHGVDFDSRPIDRNAFAIVKAPGFNQQETPKAANAAAEAAASELEKPFGDRSSFVKCTGREDNRKCRLQKGMESLLSATDLQIEGDSARVEIRWTYQKTSSESLTDLMFTVSLRKAKGLRKNSEDWIVEGTSNTWQLHLVY